jgi:hypothetical protein
MNVKKQYNLFTYGKNAKRSSTWVSNERSRPRECQNNVYFFIFCVCLHFVNINNNLFTFGKNDKEVINMGIR